MPIAETGELDAPISPAMYPHTAAISRPITSTNSNAPPMSTTPDAASGPPAMTLHSRIPIGTSIASETRPTTPIGKSRSVSASTSPPRRARLAASAEATPPITGRAIFTSVHTAATPITPAPKKRTSARNTALASSSALPPLSLCAVRKGSSTHQPVAMPTSCAMPTDRPTRCPTPSRANDSPPEIPVAPAPTRNQRAASAVASFIWVSNAKPAEARLPQISTLRPFALSAPPSRAAEPTSSTSAAARPSG